MYSIIGLLRKAPAMSTAEFRRWWVEEHVPKVKQMPGLLDYRLWPIDETLDQATLEFNPDVAYDGIAVITFASKEAFITSIGSPAGKADNESFNRGAPSSTVFGGVPLVLVAQGSEVTHGLPITSNDT